MKWKGLLDIHSCGIQNSPTLEDFYPGVSRKVKLKRYFLRLLTISFTSNLSRQIFKSTAAIQLEFLRHMKTDQYLIHPCSDFREFWERFMAFMYIVAAITIPFYCGFVSTNKKNSTWQFKFVKSVDIIVGCVGIFDILMNFVTGYIEKERRAVLYWKMIVIRYVSSYFVFDLLSSIPVDYFINLFIESSRCPWVPLLRYLKFARILTLKAYILRIFLESNWQHKHFEITWLLLRIGLGVHLFACLHKTIDWFVVHYAIGRSWLPSQQSLHPLELYLHCLSQASANFLCLGFGAIGQDHTVLKQIYVSILSLLGSYFFIKCIAFVFKWEVISNIDTANYEERMDQIKAYSHNKELTSNIHSKIKEFHEFKFQKHLYDEPEIQETFSHQLRHRVLQQSYQNFIQNVNFLKNVPQPVMLRLIVALKREVYLVNDTVISAGDSMTSMYIVAMGTIAMYDVSGNEVCHLEDGSHFGESALTSSMASRVSAVAVENTELLCLHRDDFWRALAPFPELQTRVEKLLVRGGCSEGRRDVGVVLRSRKRSVRAARSSRRSHVSEGAASTSVEALSRDFTNKQLSLAEWSMTL